MMKTVEEKRKYYRDYMREYNKTLTPEQKKDRVCAVRRWEERNKEFSLKQHREITANHKTKNKTLYSSYEKIRKQRMKVNGGAHSRAEWGTLKNRHNNTCLKCGKREPDIEIVRDHIVPVSLGGSSAISNIQPLCRKCNGGKAVKVIRYELRT